MRRRRWSRRRRRCGSARSRSRGASSSSPSSDGCWPRSTGCSARGRPGSWRAPRSAGRRSDARQLAAGAGGAVRGCPAARRVTARVAADACGPHVRTRTRLTLARPPQRRRFWRRVKHALLGGAGRRRGGPLSGAVIAMKAALLALGVRRRPTSTWATRSLLAVWAPLAPAGASARPRAARRRRRTARRRSRSCWRCATRPPPLPARLDNLLALDYPADRLRDHRRLGRVDRRRPPCVLARYAPRVVRSALPRRRQGGGVERRRARRRATTSSSSPTRASALRPTRSAASSRRSPIRGSAACRANWCSTPSSDARRPLPPDRRSARASGSTGATRSGCAGGRATSARSLGATGAIYALRRVAVAAAAARHAARRRAGADAGGARGPPRRVRAATRAPSTAPRPTPTAERRRKERTLAGNYQLLWLEPRLLVPGRQPGLAAVRVAQDRAPASCRTRSWRCWSRARRWRNAGAVYALALALQVAFYVLAAHGAAVAADGAGDQPGQCRPPVSTGRPPPREPERSWRMRRLIDRASRVAFTFAMMNYAAVAGLVAARARPAGLALSMERLTFGTATPGTSVRHEVPEVRLERAALPRVGDPPDGGRPAARREQRLGLRRPARLHRAALLPARRTRCPPSAALHLAEVSAIVGLAAMAGQAPGPRPARSRASRPS